MEARPETEEGVASSDNRQSDSSADVANSASTAATDNSVCPTSHKNISKGRLSKETDVKNALKRGTYEHGAEVRRDRIIGKVMYYLSFNKGSPDAALTVKKRERSF